MSADQDVSTDKPAEQPSTAPAAEPEKKRDPVLRGAVKATAATGIALTIMMAIAVGPGFAIGTLIGGALAASNLILFIRVGEVFLSQRGKGGPWAVLGGLKLVALLFCVFIILRQGAVSALAFVIGYGSLPIGISLSSFFGPKPAP